MQNIANMTQVSDVAHGPFVLFNSLPELKAQVSFSGRLLSVFCLSIKHLHF
jgi:hypothetical protein